MNAVDQKKREMEAKFLAAKGLGGADAAAALEAEKKAKADAERKALEEERRRKAENDRQAKLAEFEAKRKAAQAKGAGAGGKKTCQNCKVVNARGRWCVGCGADLANVPPDPEGPSADEIAAKKAEEARKKYEEEEARKVQLFFLPA